MWEPDYAPPDDVGDCVLFQERVVEPMPVCNFEPGDDDIPF